MYRKKTTPIFLVLWLHTWLQKKHTVRDEPTLEAPNFTYTPPTPYPPLWVLFVPR